MTDSRIRAYFRKKQEELAAETAELFRPGDRDAKALRLDAQAERLLDLWISELKLGQGAKA